MKLKREYQNLMIQDTLYLNLSSMDLVNVEKDKWYNWRHDYVKKKYTYQDGKKTVCTFASRTADELVLIAVNSEDTTAEITMDEMLTTMKHHQNFFAKWFNPRNDDIWQIVYLVVTAIILYGLIHLEVKTIWMLIVPTVFIGLTCFTMCGDWIGVLSYAVDLIIFVIIWHFIKDADADGIDIDI